MIGDRLSKLREEKKLSQKELATRLGIARTTYSGYENNAREPDKNTLDKLADFFDVSVDYLFGRTNERNVHKPTTNDQAKNDVIEAYNRLPQDKKKLVDDIIRSLLNEDKK